MICNDSTERILSNKSHYQAVFLTEQQNNAYGKDLYQLK